MIGNVIVKTDTREYCQNGWADPTRHSCNYTAGHYCVLPRDHDGCCRCDCGATSMTVPPEWEKPWTPEDDADGRSQT